jgi:hypothetical protein
MLVFLQTLILCSSATLTDQLYAHVKLQEDHSSVYFSIHTHIL